MSQLSPSVERDEVGDTAPAESLLPLVYEELRRLASARMAKESPGNTLQATALVHEAWLRLAAHDLGPQFANKAHFFAAAAEAMRRILIERARRRLARKRGGQWERLDLENIEIAEQANDDILLLVHEALDKLSLEDSRAAELVKLRFFGGLTLDEAAQALGFSERTAKRCWAFARAWLYHEISTAMKS